MRGNSMDWRKCKNQKCDYEGEMNKIKYIGTSGFKKKKYKCPACGTLNK